MPEKRSPSRNGDGAVTDNRMRLAAWCLLVSVITAVCLWSLVGSSEIRAKGVWRSSSHKLARR